MKNNIEQQLQNLGQKMRPDSSKLSASKQEVLNAIKDVPPGGLPVSEGGLSSFLTLHNIIFISLGVLAVVGVIVYVTLGYTSRESVEKQPVEEVPAVQTEDTTEDESNASFQTEQTQKQPSDTEIVISDEANPRTVAKTTEGEVVFSDEGIIAGLATSTNEGGDEEETEKPRLNRSGNGSSPEPEIAEDSSTTTDEAPDTDHGTTTDNNTGTTTDEGTDNETGHGDDSEDNSVPDEGNENEDTDEETDQEEEKDEHPQGRRHPMRDMPEGDIGMPSNTRSSDKNTVRTGR